MTSWREKFSKLNNLPGTINRYPRVIEQLISRLICCTYSKVETDLWRKECFLEMLQQIPKKYMNMLKITHWMEK